MLSIFLPFFTFYAVRPNTMCCPTAEGHRAVPSSVSRTRDCMHVWLAGRVDLLRLFQRTLFRQADPVPRDAVRFLYTLLNTPPCERRYA